MKLFKKNKKNKPIEKREYKFKFNRQLIVDDNETNRYVLENYLKLFNIDIEIAINGKDAISKFLVDKKFDVIWMDLLMPEMDGFDASARLRKLGFEGFIIALTGHVDKEATQKCLKNGMDHVLAKPIFKKDFYTFLYEKFGLEK